MEYINTRPLTYLVHRIQHSSRVMTVFTAINESCHLNLKFECPENVLATAKRINEREVREKKYKPHPDQKRVSWVFGEFKIFIWTVVYKCLINGLQIQELSLEVIKEIQNIFKSKSLCFIQYEIQVLINQKYDLTAENWQEDELAIFADLMARHGPTEDLNWRIISFEMFQASGARYFRSVNHCREKWFNHLNPQVKKGDWTLEEDIRIFELLEIHGLKWSKISRDMGKIRTEHMVKNRFNHFYRDWKIKRDTPVETVCKLFQDRVLKPYLRRKATAAERAADGQKQESQGEGQEVSLRRPVRTKPNPPMAFPAPLPVSLSPIASPLDEADESYHPSEDEQNLSRLPNAVQRTAAKPEAEQMKVKVEMEADCFVQVSDAHGSTDVLAELNKPVKLEDVEQEVVEKEGGAIMAEEISIKKEDKGEIQLEAEDQRQEGQEAVQTVKREQMKRPCEVKMEQQELCRGECRPGWNYYPFMSLYYPPPMPFPF